MIVHRGGNILESIENFFGGFATLGFAAHSEMSP
jgi:hypothetical protein